MHSAVGRGQGRMFTLNPQEVHASTTAVIGTLLVDKVKARVLFDSGATHSFISLYFRSEEQRLNSSHSGEYRMPSSA